MKTFNEGDEIWVYPVDMIKMTFHNQIGLVMKWHHDDIYTVYMRKNNVLITLHAYEMEKT